MINNGHNNPAMLHWLRQIKLSQQRGLSQLFVSAAQLPAAHFSRLHILLLSIHGKPNELLTSLSFQSQTGLRPWPLVLLVLWSLHTGFVIVGLSGVQGSYFWLGITEHEMKIKAILGTEEEEEKQESFLQSWLEKNSLHLKEKN